MIIVIGTVSCDPAHAADYTAEALVSVETRKEPGNLHYALLAKDSVEGQFVGIERWENDAVLEAHMQTAHAPHFAERTLSYKGDAEFSVFDADNQRPPF
jgi:quinol monooxygenase YgiN